MPIALSPSPSATRAALLAKLGTSEESLRQSPRITPELRRIARALESASSNAPRDPYYYLAASDAPEARAILTQREKLSPPHRKLIPIEAFCLAASISPLRILEIITATAVRLGAQASTIIAAVSHPRVVEKTVEMALTDGGESDRTTLHKATGFLPTPKGSQTVVHIAANASANAAAAAPVVVQAPPPEHTIKTLVDRFNERRASLPAPTILELAPPAPSNDLLAQATMPVREAELVDILDADEDDL